MSEHVPMSENVLMSEFVLLSECLDRNKPPKAASECELKRKCNSESQSVFMSQLQLNTRKIAIKIRTYSLLGEKQVVVRKRKVLQREPSFP